MATTPVFDGSLFDDALFGGSSGLFDTEKFDPALFDAGLPPVLNARVFWAEVEVPAAAAPAGTQIKAWNGAAWVTGTFKRWNGSAWEAAALKRWNGSAWISA